MDENQSSNYILVIMKNLNLIIILYISLLIAHSLSEYIREGLAQDFITTIYQMPIAAWKIPIISVGLYCSCLLLIHIKNVTSLGLFLKVCLELGISFYISYIIGFSYAGLYC